MKGTITVKCLTLPAYAEEWKYVRGIHLSRNFKGTSDHVSHLQWFSSWNSWKKLSICKSVLASMWLHKTRCWPHNGRTWRSLETEADSYKHLESEYRPSGVKIHIQVSSTPLCGDVHYLFMQLPRAHSSHSCIALSSASDLGELPKLFFPSSFLLLFFD